MSAFIGFAFALTIFIFWGGYVSSVLWGWFVVPLGVKAITYWHAVGLSAVVASFFGFREGGNKYESPEADVWELVLKSALIPTILLALGYLAKNNL